MGGIRGIVYIFDTHWVKFSLFLGMNTNNRVDILALNLILLSTTTYRGQSYRFLGIQN